MSAPVLDLSRIDKELTELAEALRHTRDDLWRKVFRKRADTLLDRRNALTRS